ncbi:MAG TPA: hypothetical protein VGB70_01585 [Allosphingosinicella sp.]|jgi:hypothetical protein
MLLMIAIAASSPLPAAQTQEPIVCRSQLRRTELTFFRYRREKVCATQSEWRAADFRQALHNDAGQLQRASNR